MVLHAILGVFTFDLVPGGPSKFHPRYFSIIFCDILISSKCVGFKQLSMEFTKGAVIEKM